MDIGDGHRRQTKSPVELAEVSPTELSEVFHVEVEAWKMKCDVVDSNL
jgi:hypothetical protein